jgi:hypothetical protein
MRHYLAGFTALILAACNSADSDTGPSPSGNLSGTWQFQSTFDNQELQASCQAAGEVSIRQSGNSFTGQVIGGEGICISSVARIPIIPGGTITEGKVDGRTVSFTKAPCTYAGTVSSVSLVSGTTDCILTVSEAEDTFSGTWRMTR